MREIETETQCLFTGFSDVKNVGLFSDMKNVGKTGETLGGLLC